MRGADAHGRNLLAREETEEFRKRVADALEDVARALARIARRRSTSGVKSDDLELFKDSLAVAPARHGGAVLWHDYGIWLDVTRALEDLAERDGFALRNIAGTSLVYWRKP